MKKIIVLLTFVLMLCLISCESSGTTKPTEQVEKSILINYYVGDDLVYRDKYFDKIELIDYQKADYAFGGWYLDPAFEHPYDASKEDTYFENPTMSLYAKMERIMKDFGIELFGLVDGAVVLNPAFRWENSNEDSSFNVKLMKGEEVIEELTTENNFYQVKNDLQGLTDYKFVVLGAESEHENSISFRTMSKPTSSITKISLANPFSDGAVIQRNKEIEFSGYGPEFQVIKVEVAGSEYYGVANDEGAFTIKVKAQPASFEAQDVTFTNGKNVSMTLADILFGDVYLFAGQSNMQWQTNQSDYMQSDIDKLIKSSVRFFAQDVVTSTTKKESVTNGRWFKPTQTNVMYFSAIATMSGAFMSTTLQGEAPIGIITAYQGDTNIANWMGSEYYFGTCATKYLHYNAMVYPLRHTKLTGVVWYQGCNNSAAGCDYKDLLLDFFTNYRELFNSEKLPFYVIGLACYDGDSGNNFDFSYVRESQAKACAEDDDAYFISTVDDGDPTYIHPRAKRYICERVAKSIAGSIYGKNYATEGPSYKEHVVSGNVVTILLNNAKGLKATGEIKGLYLAGEDGKYYEANAQISGETIVATCAKVPNPVYVKYGFGKSPFVNIFNRDNFAITPFRTDNYNTNIDLFDYESIAKYTFHPDGSRMELFIDNTNNNLRITKINDGKTYGSVRLDKWGAIAYLPEGFQIRIIGHNSGAAITFRAIEGDSYEVWGYKIVDDFEGERTFTISVGDFVAVYNKKNNIFEPQKISYIELMVEVNGAATFELCEARFISIDRTKPMNFTISQVAENASTITVDVSKALFAESFELTIREKDASDPLYVKEQNESHFVIPKEGFKNDIPYYISVIAKNELGETEALNNGFVFYLKDANKFTVCNFDFQNQAALDAYMASSMAVHQGLICTLEDQGVKITSTGAGWQNFIFKLESGAGNGMSKLQFKADFSNYHGQVIMQLADTSWKTYSYTINLNENNEGIFVINFSDFVTGDTPFTTQTLMWVMFNFNDNVGNGYIILDDVVLLK